MSTAAAPEIALSPEVQGFLKQHQAEIAFEKVCELVRECYPHLLHMHARLRDDPDVEDREWCVIDVTVPLIENVEQRLARWLLMAHDRVGRDQFPLTQEVAAMMLGASRSTVTLVAGTLQKAGLITYHRGTLTIQSEPGNGTRVHVGVPQAVAPQHAPCS